MISTLVDKTTNIFDDNFLQLSIDYSNLEILKNDTFKNALFYESLKQDVVDNSCYLYLLITSNYYSKYNFISYQSPVDLENLLIDYINYKFNNTQKQGSTITSLDRLLLQLGSLQFSSSMEIDHIFPVSKIKISNRLDKYLNINHIGNLCYISKNNNQKKSNKLPHLHIEHLKLNDEKELLNEFLTNSFINNLEVSRLINAARTVENFNKFLTLRSKILISKVIEEVS